MEVFGVTQSAAVNQQEQGWAGRYELPRAGLAALTLTQTLTPGNGLCRQEGVQGRVSGS